MKIKIITLLCALAVAKLSNAQPTPAQVEGRSDTAERTQPAPLTGQDDSQSNSSDADVSDTGAQRPISLKKDGISAYFGFDSRYFYRSNPLATESAAKQPTGMWTNTFYTGAGLGVFDMDSYILTPYIGGSWTINDYVEGELSKFNYNSTSAYALLLAQFGNGWSARVGYNYAMDRSTDLDTEDYNDLSPNLGLMKAHSISPETTGIFDISVSTHETEAFVLPGQDEGKLNNNELSVSYGLKHIYGPFTISPKYRLSFKQYDTDDNDGRDDTTHNLNLKIDYDLAQSLKLTAFGGYSKRTSSGTVVNYDYESYDAGAAIGLTARF